MYSLFQHPFITYTFVLSSALAVLAAIALRLAPQRSVHRNWLYAAPLVVPVLSYVINYVLIGKTCEYSHSHYSYIGFLQDLPSYHLLCQLNYRITSWVAPVSLIWLAFSLSAYGLAWCRTYRLLRHLPPASKGDARARGVLDSLCNEQDVKPPALRALDYPYPLMFTGGTGGRVVTVSTGALDLLDDDELRAALAHELAHIRRNGHVLNWFLVLCRNLTFFSPAALWSYAAFRAEEEQVCDALAASQTGLGAELASAIVKFMRHGDRTKWAHSLASLSPGGNPGVARVKRLLDAPVANTERSRWVYALLALLSIGSVFIC
ncbi:MAG: M56 family metallopeptidase [Clostridia bacterium]